MRSTIIALAIALSAVPAFAATTDAMGAFYANTMIVSDRGTGFGSTLLLNADNTYVATVTQNGHSLRVGGTWTLGSDSSTVCLTSTTVGAAPSSATSGCLSLGGHAVGDKWSVTNSRQQALDLQLSEGR